MRKFCVRAVSAGLLLGLSFLNLSCDSYSSSSSDSDTEDATTALRGLAVCEAQAGSAVICGRVLAADGTTPVVGAEILLVDESTSGGSYRALNSPAALTANSSACLTDDAGEFACVVEDVSGLATFKVDSDLFGTALEFEATCTEDATTTVDEADTTASTTQFAGVEWLVVPGTFDGIQLLLSDLKGCTLSGDEVLPATLRGSDDCEAAGLTVLGDEEIESFLATESLGGFQAIFINCDADYQDVDGVNEALQDFVNAGGNVYFSDLSDTWLTAAFPDLITFPADEDKNSTRDGTMEDADVLDTGLQAFLGSSDDPQETMDVVFDLGVWTAMSEVVATWTTYIEGAVDSLSTSDGLTGTVPVTVGGPQEDGCIFYTSYHVEGALEGSDQELALKYLVLNRMNNCD